jgi:predicted transcriptional regulator of viral defense system
MSNITERLLELHNSQKTVFTTADLMLFWGVENRDVLKTTVSRAVKKGYLKHIRRGLYGLNKKMVNNFELAGKLKKNSYISFETVLLKNDVINQWYDTVFSASNRKLTVKNKYGEFNYRKIPDYVLNNRLGLINAGNYFIADTERAICDYFYKVGFQQLDNLDEINTEQLIKISKIYNNKRLEKDVLKLVKLVNNNS